MMQTFANDAGLILAECDLDCHDFYIYMLVNLVNNFFVAYYHGSLGFTVRS